MTISVPSSRRGRTATGSRPPTSRSSPQKAWCSTIPTCSRLYAVQVEIASSRKRLYLAAGSENFQQRISDSHSPLFSLCFSGGNAPTRPTCGHSKRISEPVAWTPQAHRARSGSPSRRCSNCTAGTCSGWGKYFSEWYSLSP